MTAKYPNSRLSPYQAEMIRREYQSGRFTQRQLAERFQVTQPVIWSIVNNQSWKKKQVVIKIEHSEAIKRWAFSAFFLAVGIFIGFAICDNLLYQPTREAYIGTQKHRELPPRVREIQRISNLLSIPPGMASELIQTENELRFRPGIMFKVAYRESAFNSRAIGRDGEIGLCQIFLETARDYFPRLTREDLLDYRVNIRVSAKHLKPLIDKYGLNLGLIYYNCGENRGQRIGHIWLRRLDNYARAVLYPKNIRDLLN